MSREFTRIHKRVADILDMQVDEQVDEPESENAIVAAPEVTDVVLIDNPELPILHNEMMRLEHSQRQTEFLLEQGLAAVQQTLMEIQLLPPMYKPKAISSVAELFAAVSALSQHRTESQLKQMELKMKLAAFSRNKAATASTISGNTFIINREELIKAYSQAEDGDD